MSERDEIKAFLLRAQEQWFCDLSDGKRHGLTLFDVLADAVVAERAGAEPVETNPQARIAQIHRQLGEHLAQEEALLDELERLGDTTYEVTDADAERTMTTAQEEALVELSRVREELATATERVRGLGAMLRTVEWNTAGGGAHCKVCRRWKDRQDYGTPGGHAPDCALAALLATPGDAECTCEEGSGISCRRCRALGYT